MKDAPFLKERSELFDQYLAEYQARIAGRFVLHIVFVRFHLL